MAIQAAPLERLLLETDAPEIYQGEKSEPKDLIKTLHFVSELRKKEKEEIAKQTFLNSLNLFQLSL